jgi:phosphatidate cytidylyltransferase
LGVLDRADPAGGGTPAGAASEPVSAPVSAPGSDPRRVSELTQRIAFGVVAAPLTVWIVVVGGAPLVALLAVTAAVGAWELYRIARASGAHPIEGIGIPLAAACPIVLSAEPRGVFTISPVFAAGALMLVFAVAIWRRRDDGRPLSAVATTLFGASYTGGLLSFAFAIRYHRYIADDRGGTALLLLPLVLVWANDIGAYAVGRAIGGRKLIPGVSPGKTVAGAVGGLVVTVLACWLYVTHALRPWAELALRPEGILIFGTAVSIAAQVGDLAESLLKREAGVKNSSRLFPGHGGVLDRVDSLLFVLPVAYMLFDIPGFLLMAPSSVSP